MPEALEIPAAGVASLRRSAGDIEQGTDPTLSSLVNVVDYPEGKTLVAGSLATLPGHGCLTRGIFGKHSQRSTLHQT